MRWPKNIILTVPKARLWLSNRLTRRGLRGSVEHGRCLEIRRIESGMMKRWRPSWEVKTLWPLLLHKERGTRLIRLGLTPMTHRVTNERPCFLMMTWISGEVGIEAQALTCTHQGQDPQAPAPQPNAVATPRLLPVRIRLIMMRFQSLHLAPSLLSSCWE